MADVVSYIIGLALGGDNLAAPGSDIQFVGAFGFYFDGTNWDRIRGDSTDGLLVNLGANNDVTVSETPPTSPVNTYITTAALAANATANLDTGELGAVKLAQVEVFGSVAYKALVYKIENGVASAIQAVGGHMQGGAWSWKPPHRNYMAISASAGVDGFRVAVTNLDDSHAADFYATFHTES